MYFNPLTQFVRSLVSGKRRLARRVRRPLSNRERRRMGIGSWLAMSAPAELLEERAMLSGPSLVTIAPNTGGFLANGQVTTEAPKELTFTFSPGSSIDPNTLAAGISVTRSGVDNAFGDANDQAVTPGFMGVAVAGNGSNQVTLRFADTLPDDLYRISITGALKNTANESFNSGVTQTLDFRVDYGAQVISLVPQPVLRTENLNVLNFSKISDLDTFTITAGGAPVTFQFKNTATGSVVGAGNTAILYSVADNATTLATKINAAINTKFGVGGAVSSTRTGTTLALAGDAFTPNVKISTSQSGALSVTDGSLVQKRDTIVAYFNQDALNPTLAQDPGYYRVINTADGTILLPSSIKYDSVSNTAVLKFGADLPDGTFHLTIGAPNPAQNTLNTAAVVGTLFGDTGGYSTTAFLGNANHLSSDANDVDLYKFRTGNGTNITVDASQLAAELGGVVYLRLFDVNGVELAHSDPTSLTTPNQLIFAGSADTAYFVGVSSVSTSGTGNKSYNPTTGTGATGGVGTGSYKLSIQVNGTLPLNSDTTSFATSTSLGTLGAAGHTISDAIAPLGNLSYPTLPGGADEPGHREINVVGENNAGIPLQLYIPGSINQIGYNFQDIYGKDPQNNILHNAITEEQKDLARQIFEIYGSYLGVEFVETSNLGLTVVTGDTRAVDPLSPPDALGGIFGGSNVGTVDAIVNASAVPGGSSQYGGTWFAIAFHEIGHALGLEHSYDAPSVMGQGVGGATGVEPVYPGDINLVPAKNLNAPDSTDVNLYKFQLDQGGVFSAEIIAQRLTLANGNADPSLLDSVVTLYKEVGGVRTIVARNDDYFGKDSFVSLHLDAGIYYLAVSSTGNTAFDPSVSDTGFGGRTDGNYDLKLNFTADPAAGSTLNDLNGIALDGDANAATGGTFNFWFQSNTAANTIFVDKTNSADLSQTGSISHAYSTISAALAAATPGKVVRIVGNGGTDGDGSTLGDNKAYLIGFDSLGNAAADGSDFKVPQGVTVMIDAGAVLKFQGAVIDVGDSVPGVDRSGSSLQVLGTPDRNVYFTSLRNNAIGGNTDPTNFLPAVGGNWGGIVFRQASDVQGVDYRKNGIFLNSVNQANITYGGGQVFEDSVLQVFNPIHIANPDQHSKFFARPAVWNNTITLNADAAISADPNSFFNTLDRVGPDIHGNKVVNNTINGLFIRVSTPLSQGLEKLEVPARFDETDITFVLTETLLIAGSPGGPLVPNPSDVTHAGWDARVAGGLIIDPGVILKMTGAHIETQVGGSQLIAEGTTAHPVVFTSLKDDSYGAGGTFDTGNDGKTAGTAANWGGLFFNSASSGSIDNAIIQFGGGNLFNAIEVQQAQVRVTNTLFQNNADGNAQGSSRNGLLDNAPAVIFVRGAQPVIVNNRFVNNSGDIISVNANALNSQEIADWGRSTGSFFAFTQFVNNHGPLVRLNTYANNQSNGMAVRGEILTTETTWDDTDIVHIVRSQIVDSLNLHTYGGLRLQSSPDASLVVKLLGANAGFLINGTPLDIDDRIGGTLQIIGTPGHPVVFTSLNDDTVGAGFRPDGQPQLDTNGNGSATTPAPGDWNSISFLQYANDTNVAVNIEFEQIANQQDTNGTPATAEFVGNLASQTPSDNSNDAKGGNDDQPLGFEVHGFLNKPTDVDVYSFNALAGTEVWFDIGRTSSSLDTVIELIDANGVVKASSNDSQNDATLGGLARSMIKNTMLGGDFYTTNPRDAGFRVVLPGTAGVQGTYFIRVRSNGGLTKGEYQLQIRLQQVYEHPGSTVRYADIRYATNGIEIHGLPGHSPLGGTSTSAGGNNSFGSAQGLGNVLASDQSTINVGGSLSTSTQVDWYKFNVDYDLIQTIGGVNGAAKTFAAIFDVDYADGLARPNLTISIFDANGNLILVSRNSDVASDQPGPLQGTGLTDLSRGSVGKLDPFLGTVMMPAGTLGNGSGPENGGGPLGTAGSRTYYVAISANTQLPSALEATFKSDASEANKLVRLEPVNSIKRIVEDHIGESDGNLFPEWGTPGYTSGSIGVGVLEHMEPTTGPILPIATTADLALSVKPFTLGDVGLYITGIDGTTANTLFTVNPFTGTQSAKVGQIASPQLYDVRSLQFRSDGILFAYQSSVGNTNFQNNAGQIFAVDPSTAATKEYALGGNDGIPDVPQDGIVTNANQLTTNTVDSFFWIRNDPNAIRPYTLYLAVHDFQAGTSRLYLADSLTGAIDLDPQTPWGIVGQIDNPTTNIGFTTGMVRGNDGNTYGVTSNGYLIRINLFGGTGLADIVANLGSSFTGLTLGPQNALGGPNNIAGFYKDMLFAVTSSGQLRAFNYDGTPQGVFAGGATQISTGISNAQGLAFSPLDFNLWHPTTQGSNDAGHGINGAFDNSRGGTNGIGDQVYSINGRTTTQSQGGASFYFGLEQWLPADKSNTPLSTNYYLYNGVNAQYGILNSNYHQDLTFNRSVGGYTPNIGNSTVVGADNSTVTYTGNYNLPGGAYGSLVTKSFSLATYSSTDLPTLYFDYLLGTQQSGGNVVTGTNLDSARVFVSTDGGLTWELVATNNSTRSNPAQSSELPQYLTAEANDAVIGNGAAFSAVGRGQYVQELYDTEDWRQARVDLSKYAGLGNLTLRFDFSTSGSSMANFSDSQGLPGDETSRGAGNGKRTEDNQHIGFFVDDIMVGLAGRGEMVTGTTPNNTTFFAPNPSLENDTNYQAQQLTGAYELNIRRGTDYTSPVYFSNGSQYRSTIIPNFPNIALDPNQLDINDVLASGYSIQALPGSTLADGQTFAISDGLKTVTFEFDSNGSLIDPINHRAVTFAASDANYIVARSIRDAINSAASAGQFAVTASLADGTITGGGTNSTNSIVVLFNAVSATSINALADLTVTLNAGSIAENGGSTTGTVTRQGLPSGALAVTLTVIDPATGLPVPDIRFSANNQNTVVINLADGQSSAGFTINGSDNGLVTGTRTFVIRPTAFGHSSVGAPIDVTDNEAAALTVAIITPNVNEGPLGNPGTGTARVTRNTPTTEALTVTLASLSPNELSVPATVTIPAGQTFVQFTITAVQDGAVDGNKTATIAAYASGYAAGTGDVTIVDSGVQASVPVAGPTINLSQQLGNDFNGDIAVDRTQPLNRFAAATNDGLAVGLVTSYSIDGGATWTKKIIANGTDAFATASGSPVVAADDFGNLFLAYLNADRSQVVVLLSVDFGQTFTQLTTLSGTSLTSPAIDTGKIVNGSSSVWLAWASDAANGTVSAAGAAVTAKGTVAAFGAAAAIPNSTNGLFPTIAVSPLGRVMVAFQTPPLGTTVLLDNGPNLIRYSVDSDGLGAGAFPANPTTLTTTNVGSNETIFPVQYQNNQGINAGVGLAWDRSGGAHDGRVYMVYTAEDINTSGQYDIFLRFSDNNGTTWSNVIKVNDDTGLSAQFFPRIAVDQVTGNVAIVWYDTRNDFTFGPGNTDGFAQDEVQVWGAVVTYPGGALTVGPNAQISEGSSSVISGAFAFSQNFGDHIGLDFNNGVITPVWSDNSGGLPANANPPRLELATADVSLGVLAAPPTVTATLNAASATEGGGTTGTVTLSAPAPRDMDVVLTLNDPSLANVSAAVHILAGNSSGAFSVSTLNNSIAGGTQTLVIQPSAPGYRPVGTILKINDDDTPQLGLTLNGFSTTEGFTLTGTVSRNTPTDNQLVVTLYSTDVTEATVPLTVIIPAGATSIDFTITGVQDFVVDGTHVPRIVAYAQGLASASTLVSVSDSGVESTTAYIRRGDQNPPRRQGVININSNTIRDVLNTGILVSSPPRDGVDGNLPHPGSVINTPTLNADKIVPGPQINNNVIYNFGQTGIAFSGDSNPAGTATAAVPYGRIVNNTIFGGASAAGKTGILVSNNAAPTIINNIVANVTGTGSTGISIDASSTSRTRIDTTLFKGNASNGVVGLNAISLGNAQPLFVNSATGNFYLAPGSLAIDSSLNTKADLPSIVSVKSPLGIPESPVIAPGYDRFGQLRIDDPNTPNAGGLGLNIFKDRGAVERADFVGPSAGLAVPLDNGPDDGEPGVGTFFMTTPVPLSEIDVELIDVGIGIDPATVSSSAFVLKQDGVTLVDGVDYVFSYNQNTGRVAFLSVSVFPSSSTYTVEVDTTVIKDFAGNALQGNQPDGSSLFTIIGNAPPSLTGVTTLPGLKNIPRDITFAELKNASDLKVVTGHTPQFRIESVTSGSLTITHLGVTSAVIPGTTLFVDGDTLTWTPPVNATGATPAFTVIGYDPENAVIAPALQFSSPAVSVSINLVNVGPVLTTISTLPGAVEDTNFLISYATLKAASDLADANNDNPLSFQIMSVLPGSTLEISVDGILPYTPVVAGTTLFSPGNVLRWKAPLNQNNELNGNNPLNAFSVLGTDGEALSGLTPILVKIDVAPLADAPIMTTLSKFGLGGLNSQFPILFSDLVSHSDVQNVDGHEIQFRIEGIAPGSTLQIKHLGSVTTVVPGTTVVVAGDSLFWTPPLGAFGSAVDAFNIVAFDGLNSFPNNVSSPVLTAQVEVINSPAPTLTTLATLTRPRFVPTPITFADLQAASNVTIAAGHTLGFRIDSLSSGTLQITHLGVTTTAVAGTVVVAGDTLTWTSIPGATGGTDAFKVLAVDVTNTLTSLDPVQVKVNLVNFAPTLSTVTTFGGAIQQTPYNITYSMLQAAANEFDANNDAIGFRIQSVQNGTLKITKSGTSTAVAVVPGVTLVEAGDVLTWTGAVGSNGTIAAFAIRAWDGSVESNADIQVSLNVAAFGSQYSLSGPWVVGGKLARINQVGSNLTFSDQNNAGSSGAYTSFNTITGRNGLTGVVDTSTPDNGRIVWSDGAVWLKLSVGGQYYVPAANNDLVKVTQTGVSLSFYNRHGQIAIGTFISPTVISIPDWKVTVSYTNGALSFSNGAYWKKLDLSPAYTESVSGQKVGVIQRSDSVELTFVDTVGGTSKGVWNSPTQVTATDWNSVGTVINGQILWTGGVRNGEIWNKNLVLVGNSSVAGPGVVTITATNNQILLTNRVGTVERMRIVDANTMVNIDTGKVVKRVNGKLEFPDALTWGNFDFNALDAVFSDIKTFPFGS